MAREQWGDIPTSSLDAATKGYVDSYTSKFLDVTDTAAAKAAINADFFTNVMDYGATGDGVTDDTAAFTAALADLDTVGGGVLRLPPSDIAVTLTDDPTFIIPGNTTIIGTPGVTRFLMNTNGAASSWRGFATTSGDNVHIIGVEFQRVEDCALVVLRPGGHTGFHLKDCRFDGQMSAYTEVVHGISLDETGTKTTFSVKGCTFTDLRYGVLQSNATTATMSGFTVDDCDFIENQGDDLSFNAPNSLMERIVVSNCRFIDNQSDHYARGYPVSLAHVSDAVVRDCYFTNCNQEAIHLEDYCTNIVISGNRIHHVGQGDFATTSGYPNVDARNAICVVSGCTDVLVTGNIIDQRDNTNTLPAIEVRTKYTGTTPGGRTEARPSRVTISDNIILCGDNYQGIWSSRCSDITIRGNQLYGSGVVTGGVYDDANKQWAIGVVGGRVTISDNVVRGFKYGFGGSELNSWWALGNPGVVTNNMVTDCYVGILAVTAGAVNISSNTMSNCVRPLVVGEGTEEAQPCIVTGNLITGCEHAAELAGHLVMEAMPGISTLTIGSGRTMSVRDNLKKLPIGTVFTFSSGGTFTVTTDVPYARLDDGDGRDVIGDVAGASIAAGEVGVTANLQHSTTTANNHMIRMNNAVVPADGVGEALTNYPVLYTGVTGTWPGVSMGNSTDTNVGFDVLPKGSGSFRVYVTTGQTPTIQGRGADTNHNLNLTSQGTGVVQANGVQLADISSAQKLSGKQFVPGKTSTATSAGTLVLTADSSQIQEFTGSTTHTMRLPSTDVVAGQTFTVINNSSGAVTVTAADTTGLLVVNAGRVAVFTAKSDTPGTSWTNSINTLSGGTNASSGVSRDSYANISADAFVASSTSTATSAGTLTMSIDSTQTQVFTGSTTHTVKLPTTSVTAGQSYTVVNQSSGNVTVQSSDASTIGTLSGASSPTAKLYVALQSAPTTAAHWREI